MNTSVLMCQKCGSTRLRPHCDKDHPTCDLVVCRRCGAWGNPHNTVRPWAEKRDRA